MRIGTVASQEAIKPVACLWLVCWERDGARGLSETLPAGAAKVGEVIVHVRRITSRLARRAEIEHLGATQAVVVENAGRAAARKGLQERRRVEFRKEDQHAFSLDLLTHALYDVTTTIPAASGEGFEPAEIEIADEKMASAVWRMLKDGERERVGGSLHAGQMLAVTGILPMNEALRTWALEEMPGLSEFVDEQADRLSRAHLEVEEGKG